MLVKKYSIPMLFSIVGIALIIVSFTEEQPSAFIFASFIIFLTSILLFLSVSGKVSNKITNIIGTVSFLLAGTTLYFAVGTVDETVNHQNSYKQMKALSIRNLKDVQTAQKDYKAKYKTYTANWEELIYFIENDSIPTIERKGSVPNRKINEAERDYLIQFGLYKRNQAIDNKMTDLEAYYLSKSDICPPELITFKRDTINVSFIETMFTKNSGYMTERKQNNFGKFNAKKLKFIPQTEDKKVWDMDTVMIATSTDTSSYLRLEGVLPFVENEGSTEKELMTMGSLEDNNLSGSWEDESIKPEAQLPKSAFLAKLKAKKEKQKKKEEERKKKEEEAKAAKEKEAEE
jgi:hypothetical protein